MSTRGRKRAAKSAETPKKISKKFYEVEKIVKSQLIGNTVFYTIEWLNWSPKDNTDEPEFRLNCEEKLMDYAAARLGTGGFNLQSLGKQLEGIDDLKFLEFLDPLAIIAQTSVQCGSVKFCSTNTIDNRLKFLKYIRDHDQHHLLNSLHFPSIKTIDQSFEIYEKQLQYRRKQFPEYPIVRMLFPLEKGGSFFSPPPLSTLLFEPVTQEMFVKQDNYPDMFPQKSNKIGFNKVRPFIVDEYFKDYPESLDGDNTAKLARKNYSEDPRFEVTLELRQDPVGGWNLSTMHNVKAGTPLMMMAGVIRPSSVARKSLETEGMQVALSSFIEIPGTGKVLDRRQFADFSKYIPHSCDPTCSVRLVHSGNVIPDLVVFAKVPFQNSKGNDLSLDYYKGFEDIVNSQFKTARDRNIFTALQNKKDFVQCMCGADKCRQILYIPQSGRDKESAFGGVKLTESEKIWTIRDCLFED